MKKYINGQYIDTDKSYGTVYKELGYEKTVEILIRGKYDVCDELAILRQRDEKKAEYDEYYAYCEDCKKRARELTK